MLRNTETTWGSVAQLLHWLIAALIGIQCLLGWMAVSWKLSPTKISLFFWHKSLGILLLAIVALRLGWRTINPTPRLPAGVPAWEHATARTSHILLYVLLIAMPVSGWIVNSAANIPFRVFGWFSLPALTAPDKALAAYMKTIHLGLFVVLALALALHIAAALRHHFWLGHDILRRMLPQRGARG